MQKKLVATKFVQEKARENYPNFEKSVHVIQHDLQGLIAKNIDGELTVANHLSHILYKWVRCVNNSKC